MKAIMAIMWWKLSGVNIFYHGITGDYYSDQGFGDIGVVDSVEVALFSFCWLACFAEPCLAFFFFFFLLTVVYPWSSIASLLGFLHSAVDSILFLSDEGPMLETLDYTIRIGSIPTFLYFDLYLYSAYAAHFV